MTKMQDRLALHTWTLDTTPLPQLLPAIKKAGWGGVELRRIDFTRCHDAGMSNAQVLDLVRASGLTVAAVGCEYGLLFAKGDERRRIMKVLEETTSGDIYDENKNFNYYTGQLYSALFFTIGKICGENNIVAGREFSTSGLSGMAKHKEQLKMLFFNPGKKINGLPFIGNKTAIFDDNMADKYDMSIDMDDYNKTSCYIFKIKAKRSDVVIDEMTTWFNDKTFEIVARNYSLSYDAGVYDFNVQMQVEMTKTGNILVPSLIRYVGNWKAIFKKRERGVFTATLYDLDTGK